MMIKLELNDSDWQTSKGYWNDLKKQFVKPDDVKKAHFVDRVLFNSNPKHSTTRPTPQIPSIHSMSEIMREIDKELKNDEKNDADSDIDIKTPIETTTTITTTEKKEDTEWKQFIRQPVKFFYYPLHAI